MAEAAVEAAPEVPVSEFEATVAKMKSGDVSMFDKPATDETAPASSAEEAKADVEPKAEPKPVVKEPVEKADPLQVQLDALKKELARRTDKAEELREELGKVKGQLEEKEKQAKANSTTKSVKDLKTDELIALETDWDEVLSDAKANGDADKVQRAKANKNAIKTELQHRAEAAGAAKGKEVSEEDTLKTELTAVYEDAYTAFPELKEKDSELWKAAQAQYAKLPKRFQESGVVGDMMAVVRAIAKNPKLLGARETKARQEVLGNLEKAADKALTTGASSTNIKPIPDFAASSSEDINAMAERLKSGKPLLK
jgi:hypothetical protein